MSPYPFHLVKIITTIVLIIGGLTLFAQLKPVAGHKPDEFSKQIAETNIDFEIPGFFKELKIMPDEPGFNYGLELPNTGFEVWYQINPLKQHWQNFDTQKGEPKKAIENPDSLYLSIAQAKAISLAGKGNYFTKTLPLNALWHFNATSGKSFLLNLLDANATKHYKYGLLIVLQKDHVGNVLMLFLSNDTGPAFFRNVRRASLSIRFKS